jgi:hypothetical protein
MCEDPAIAAFPPLSAATMMSALLLRFAKLTDASPAFKDEMQKLAARLARACELKPTMPQG